MMQIQNLNSEYQQRVSRNIGHVTYEEQEKIRTSKLAIMGVGGIGGSLAEQLVRVGCQNIVICDNDRYDETNLNRQLCTEEDLGKYKVEHLKKHLQKIDPDTHIFQHDVINSATINIILDGVDIVCLSLDDPIASILIARKCREHNIPMVESWGIPYLWAWWFTQNSIGYESCYEMNTEDLTLRELEATSLKGYKELLPKLMQFPGFQAIYDRETGYFEKMKNGGIPYRSFAPFVHLTASYLTTEIIFAGLLKIKEKILAPNVVGYDYIRMKPLRFQIK